MDDHAERLAPYTSAQRASVEEVIGPRLRHAADEALRTFKSQTLERPAEARALADLYLAEIADLQEEASRFSHARRYPMIEATLEDLAGKIRRVVTRSSEPAPTEATPKPCSKPPTDSEKRGTPNWQSKLNEKKEEELYAMYLRLLEEDPDTYAPREPGTISENVKNKLADEFSVSPSTAARYIRKVENRR